MREKDIRGPEDNQITGQLRIHPDALLARHVAQFWSPNMSDGTSRPIHTGESSGEASPVRLLDLYESIVAIGSAHTIRETSRRAARAYTKGALKAPHHAVVQELVKRRKAELRAKKALPLTEPWEFGDNPIGF